MCVLHAQREGEQNGNIYFSSRLCAWGKIPKTQALLFQCHFVLDKQNT